MKKLLFAIILILLSPSIIAQEKNEILAIGTFHLHLVQAQFGVAYDVFSKEKQTELSLLAEQIAAFKPTKIFVEWEYSKQDELNELYQLYKEDSTYSKVKSKFGENESMYFASEVQQLGFRIADKLNLEQLYAFDYILPEPNDTVMKAIQKGNQADLMNEIQTEFGQYGQKIADKFHATNSIRDMLLFLNSEELEKQLNEGYVTLFNRAGTAADFSGPFFVAERYRRNLYMYSLIQKQINKTGERILVLVGAQHAAGFRDLIRYDRNIKEVKVENVL